MSRITVFEATEYIVSKEVKEPPNIHTTAERNQQKRKNQKRVSDQTIHYTTHLRSSTSNPDALVSTPAGEP